jgi:hypothetical protein
VHYFIIIGVTLSFILLWDAADLRGRVPGLSFRYLTQVNYLMIVVIRGALEIGFAIILYSAYNLLNQVPSDAWRRIATRAGIASLVSWAAGVLILELLSRFDGGGRRTYVWGVVGIIERIKVAVIAEEARRSGQALGATGSMAPRGANPQLIAWTSLIVAVAGVIVAIVQTILTSR